MRYSEIKEKLAQINQTHLLQHWNQLSAQEQVLLAKDIAQFDVALFSVQRTALDDEKREYVQQYEPFHDFCTHEVEEQEQCTMSLPHAPKVGCLLIAGGQGSRLRWARPKGTFPISIVRNKSLFQIFAEKVRAANSLLGCIIPLAIMTSEENDAETRAFFQDNDYFQLDPASVDFFMQSMLPLLNSDGNLFLESATKLAKGPCGNGEALQAFYRAGLWHKWQKQGVQLVEFLPVDNPLTIPYDRGLITFHTLHNADVTIKCIARTDSEEKIGVLVKHQEKIHVVEYSELPYEEQIAVNAEGCLKHACANISVFCFTMDFVQKAACHYTDQMPWHLAKKAAKCWTSNGITEISPEARFWKFEKFIFDLLPFADRIKALLYPREKIFAPLKNAEGFDTPAHVQAALQEADREAFFAVSGVYPGADRLFELDPQFHYPTTELIAEWKGKGLPATPYIPADKTE